jgi:hypothetical protein
MIFSLQQKPVCFLLFFVVFLPHLYAFEVNITGKELGFAVQPEFNRTFYFCYDTSLFGSLELNKKMKAEGGAALGNTGRAFDISLFGRGEFRLPIPAPLSFNLLGIYNATPDYLSHVHTLLPFLSFKGKWAGISAGTTLRFTFFDRESAISESILALSAYVNFCQTEKLKMGLEAANFDNFRAGNMGSYFLKLYSRVRLTKNLTLLNDIKIEQTGSIGLDANFYGIAYRGGLVWKW